MSELADIIINGGPYVPGQRMTRVLAGVVDVGEINALREELIRLRAAQLGSDADAACCEGRPSGHTGECWPLGAIRPAS